MIQTSRFDSRFELSNSCLRKAGRPLLRTRLRAPNPNPTTLRILVPHASKTHYEVLGVPETASADEVRRAFRRAARTMHPDVNNAPDAAESFMKLLAAYQALTDAGTRGAYDATLGMASAKEQDPRFARFYRWRREVLPALEVQLEEWGEEVEVIVATYADGICAYDMSFQEAHAAASTACSALRSGQLQASQDLDALAAAAATQLGEAAEALESLRSAVAGGLPRMWMYLEKRFEQICVRFPAYPDIVWEDMWYDTTDTWLDRMNGAVQPWARTLDNRAAQFAALRATWESLQPTGRGAGEGKG